MNAAVNGNGVTAPNSTNDFGAFLSIFAALLLENVWQFEETASRVSEMVMSSGKPSRELVVTLQAFDRLKQEFEALGDALARYAETTNTLPLSGEERAQIGRDIIAAISVADLKARLLRRFDVDRTMTANRHPAAAVDAEIGVDVVF